MVKNRLVSISLIVILLFIPLLSIAGKTAFPKLKGYKSTMNFSVYAPTQDDANRVAVELEAYYKRFLKDLGTGGMLKKKPEIFIFQNYEEYLDKAATLGYNVSHTGGIAVPRSARKPAKVYSFLSDNLVSEVLPHELTHLLFKEITAGLKTNANVPLWLNEGIAVYEEKERRYRSAVKQSIKSGQFIPIAELVEYKSYPREMHKRSLFYAQSASLVDFLLSEYGGAKFLSFSKKLVRDNKKTSKALSSTYYPKIKDVSQLSSAWLRFYTD